MRILGKHKRQIRSSNLFVLFTGIYYDLTICVQYICWDRYIRIWMHAGRSLRYLPGPLSLTGINFNPNKDNNHTPNKVREKINHPFPNFTGRTVEVSEWINVFIPHFVIDNYLFMLWLKFIHVGKRVPRLLQLHCRNQTITYVPWNHH